MSRLPSPLEPSPSPFPFSISSLHLHSPSISTSTCDSTVTRNAHFSTSTIDAGLAPRPGPLGIILSRLQPQRPGRDRGVSSPPSICAALTGGESTLLRGAWASNRPRRVEAVNLNGTPASVSSVARDPAASTNLGCAAPNPGTYCAAILRRGSAGHMSRWLDGSMEPTFYVLLHQRHLWLPEVDQLDRDLGSRLWTRSSPDYTSLMISPFREHSETLSICPPPSHRVINVTMTDNREWVPSGFWPASARLLRGFCADSGRLRGFPEARNMALVICQDGTAAGPSGTIMTRIRCRGVEVVPVG